MAILGTIPPHGWWNFNWFRHDCPKIRRWLSTTAAAVSSQLVSMPKILTGRTKRRTNIWIEQENFQLEQIETVEFFFFFSFVELKKWQDEFDNKKMKSFLMKRWKFLSKAEIFENTSFFFQFFLKKIEKFWWKIEEEENKHIDQISKAKKDRFLSCRSNMCHSFRFYLNLFVHWGDWCVWVWKIQNEKEKERKRGAKKTNFGYSKCDNTAKMMKKKNKANGFQHRTQSDWTKRIFILEIHAEASESWRRVCGLFFLLSEESFFH